MRVHHFSFQFVYRFFQQGEKALTMLNKYFTSLIDQLKTECHVKEDADTLDWLPNVAIVTGSMSLTLPVEL